MTVRERLSEEERATLLNLADARTEQNSIVEYVERLVTAARLAEAAAENEACDEICEQHRLKILSNPTDPSWTEHFAEARRDIRARMTQLRDAALEKVREEARAPLLTLFSDYEEPCESVEAATKIWDAVILRSRKAEAEAKRLREYLRWAMPFVPLLYEPRIREISDFLDAPVAGAAQEASE